MVRNIEMRKRGKGTDYGNNPKSLWITCICDYCGKEFTQRFLRQIFRRVNLNHDFCSFKCQNKALYEFSEYAEKVRISHRKAADKNIEKYKNGTFNHVTWVKYNKKQKGKTWEERFGEEKAKQIKAKLSKASSGENNPMYGKPAPSGSGNGWAGWYKGWYFRSLKELSYVINVLEKQNLNWISAETKEFRIEYKDPISGNERTYHPDFFANNTIIEVKPERLKNALYSKAKREYAEIFCKNRNWNYKFETEKTFVMLTNEEIKVLHDTKQIKFIERYEKRYNEKEWIKID
jgi:hypothetical protein